MTTVQQCSSLDEWVQALARAITARISELGITQREAARRAGFSQAAVSRMLLYPQPQQLHRLLALVDALDGRIAMRVEWSVTGG